MYDRKYVPRLGQLTSTSLTSTGVSSNQSYLLMDNARAIRIMAYVTTATVSNVSIVVTFRRRPVFGSSSNQTVFGTLTIPTAVAADSLYYKDITPVNCNIGDQIVFDVTTAAGGGGAAGAAQFEVWMDSDPETALNQTKLVASA